MREHEIPRVIQRDLLAQLRKHRWQDGEVVRVEIERRPHSWRFTVTDPVSATPPPGAKEE